MVERIIGRYLVFIYLVFLGACTPSTNSLKTPKTTPFILEVPAELPEMLIPTDNPLTYEAIALGRMLFYDPILSLDSTISCATCHRQELAFTDGRGLSIGIQGREGKRSSMSLVNVGYYHDGLFWDGSVYSLEEQSLHPVRTMEEMGANWPLITKRIQDHPLYPRLFKEAFGLVEATSIDSNWIAKALAQFERTIIGFDSKFDRVMQGKEDFTLSEQRGWTLFFDASMVVPHAECSHCHSDPLFTNLEFQNNGLIAAKDLRDFKDLGRGAISKQLYDNGKFRVPTLRNIALTAPYMHGGQLGTLEAVIEHYASGGHYSENVSPNVRELKLDERDKVDLVAFLNTLTDSVLINNEAYANPF